MSKPTTTFDAEAHAYTINGRPVPSVTQVLGDLIPGYQASEYYLGRGQAVHAYADMIARGEDFEIADTDPANRADMEGRVAALRRFFREVKPFVYEVELPVFSPKMQYAGCLDLLTTKPGRSERMVLDFKSSLGPAVPYQVSGYAIAAEETLRVPVQYGVGVEIRNDGTYRMSEVWKLYRYRIGWLSLLSAYNIRRSCKIALTPDEESA